LTDDTHDAIRRGILEAGTGTSVHDELSRNRQAVEPDNFDYVETEHVGAIVASAIDNARHDAAVEIERAKLNRTLDDVIAEGPMLDSEQLLATYQSVNSVSPTRGLELLQASLYSEPDMVAELMANRELEQFAANQEAQAEADRAEGMRVFQEGIQKLTHATEVAGVDFADTLDLADAAAEQGIHLTPGQAAIAQRNLDVVNEGHRIRTMMLEDEPALTNPYTRQRLAEDRAQIANEDSVSRTRFEVHRTAAQRVADREAAFLAPSSATEELALLQKSPALASKREQAYKRLHKL
jgi:hypothetical protein